MIAFVMPTRDRPGRLRQTVDRLGTLTLGCPAELIVVDNASEQPAAVPGRLPNGMVCRVVRLEENAGAAARNVAVSEASPRSDWIVMLDDDSHPVESVEPFAATVARLHAQPEHVAAVMADIHLPSLGCRESGGLPEVFVGCGVAIRRAAFDAVEGYDPAFGYYVEEYDLAARFLLRGWSVEFDRAFSVDHHKISAGRDMNLILGRLVRNNGWVMQRYAPEIARRDMLREQRRRYRDIAAREHAMAGYARGLGQLRRTLRGQQRTALATGLWDRFTGLAHARAAIGQACRERAFDSAAIIEPGKNAWAVEQALREAAGACGFVLTTADQAEVLVVGTLSPGPMLDAVGRYRERGARVVAPWLGAEPAHHAAGWAA